MTHPDAVEEVQDGEAVEDMAGGGIAPQLAAIQESYDEAMACIVGLARSPWDVAPDSTDPHPATEKIDVQLAKPPVVQEASTPATEAMTVAAMCLAEQPILGGERRPADLIGTSPDRRTASSRREPELRATHPDTDLSAVLDRPRRWWRALRLAPPPAPSSAFRPATTGHRPSW
jgi:hypothetical protein